MKTIVCFNLKGGVGKTETSCNISEGLAAAGFKVLHIDNDPQGNSTDRLDREFGLNLNDVATEMISSKEEMKKIHLTLSQKYTLADLFDDPSKTKAAIRPTSNPNLFLIPADLNLSNTDTKLRLDITHKQEDRLKKILRQVRDEFDVCVIDCPPTFNLLTINALCIPDCQPIIPIKIDKGGMKGWAMADTFLEEIQESFGIEIQNYKILFTMASKTKHGWVKEQQKWIDAFNRIMPDQVFKTVIRNQASPILASNVSQSFVINNTRANVGQDYRDFVKELGV